MIVVAQSAVILRHRLPPKKDHKGFAPCYFRDARLES